MSRPAAFLPGLLLATLLSTIVAIQANAQVTIRDTVEIGSNAVVGKKPSPPPPVSIPAGGGLLCAYYDKGLTWRLGASIPDTAIVSVTNNSILFASDSVTARLPVTTSSAFFACGGNVTKYAQGPLMSDDERRWSIGSVQQEDEIVFYYSRGTVPTVITQTEHGWIAKMGATCPPPNQAQYLEQVQVSFAVVEPDTSLTITPSQSTVWPDKLDEGTPGTFSTTFADPVVDEIAIRLFDGCAPIAQREVSVRAEWVYGSGGHLHETSQDSAPFFGSMGTFTDLADTTHTGQATITATTGPDGYVRLSYRAPEFGGSVDIIATAVVGTDTLVNAFRLDVKVPDLIAIPDTTGDGLIGGTCNHHGPRDDGLFLNCRTPDDNHYATQQTIDRLYDIRAAWRARFPNEPFKINDASLPFGGRFDICGEWSGCTSGHDFHRMGRDVDVRTSRDTLNPDGILVVTIGHHVNSKGKTVADAANTLFEEVSKRLGLKPTPQVHADESQNEHYHLYFY